MNVKVICSNICTKFYDKRGDFGCPIVNFPFLVSTPILWYVYFAVGSIH